MKNFLGIITIVAVGWFLLNQLVSGVISNLSIDSASLRFGNLSASGLPVVLPINVKNNSPVTIPITSFLGSLYYGSQELAPVVIWNPTNINPNSITTIEVSSYIRFADLTADLVQILKSKSLFENFRLTGTLAFGGINVPVDQVIKII